MNWNLFWGFFMLAFAVALLLVAYVLGWRSMHKKERCSARTTGTVIRYSAAQYNDMSLPVVRYHVDGRDYTVVGPRFRASVKKTVTTPWNDPMAKVESNIVSREDLPDVAKIYVKRNSFVSIEETPLFKLYPVGSCADVYYDPNKPKVAYVQRYEGSMLLFSFWIPLIAGILCVALALFFFFGPTLVMH